MMNIEALRQRWHKVFEEKADSDRLEAAFTDVAQRYGESGRFYHTLNHVSACLGLFDQVSGVINDRLGVEVALWFHDVIYEPKRKDNEAKSAAYATDFLTSIGYDAQVIQRVERYILLTIHPSEPLTDDERYLIDIDLSILGANTELYGQYEGWIRKEYAFVPGFLYRRGRKKLLRSFLDMRKIYQSNYFFELFERQARENIGLALKEL